MKLAWCALLAVASTGCTADPTDDGAAAGPGASSGAAGGETSGGTGATSGMGGAGVGAGSGGPASGSGGAGAGGSGGCAQDVFGIEALHATIPSGREWSAKWDAEPRTLDPGDTDPLDPEFQNRGSATFTIHGDGTATATGTVMRHYIWDQSKQKQWGNIELTFYARRVAEMNAPSYAGFTVEVRTDDGHTSDPDQQCLGNAYAMAMYYDGRATFKKELKHPDYTTRNPTEMVWDEVPSGVWVGFKAVVRDIGGASVHLELYRDLTEAAGCGAWEKVLDYVDQGGWQVGAGDPICGLPADRILTGAFPIVLLRNDNCTLDYAKLSVREIAPEP